MTTTNMVGPPARKKQAVETTGASIKRATIQFANQLNEFCASHTFQAKIHVQADTLEQEIDLQLAICRKLRELLPTSNCSALLQNAQNQNWIHILLQWLNLHDRPAVQVEALLAVTNIAEVCAGAGWPSFQEAMENNNSKYSYPFAAAAAAAAAAAPGSVPFPPLSFSQTLSTDAVAAFDASLANTIQSTNPKNTNKPDPTGLPLFPTSGINFTSLAPPPGGAHQVAGSNAFVPPPTPVASSSGTLSFPQQLSASSQHLLLRHADAIPTLIGLLSSPSHQVYEQAMWILGSIAAGDAPGTLDTNRNTNSNNNSSESNNNTKSVSARDVILAAGVMNQLLRCLETHPNNLSLQRIGSWTLSNLLDNIFQQSNSNNSNSNNNNSNGPSSSGSSNHNGASKTSNNTGTSSSGKNNNTSEYSSADEIEMDKLLPTLQRLLSMTDSEVLSYTCWCLSHLCDSAAYIATVVTKPPPSGLVPRLVELLVHPSWRVTKPALRTIGNIVCAECSDDGTDYTEVILDCNAVPRLKELITHSNREIQKEACWTLSNISAGTVDQIQAVIDSGAIPPLVTLVKDKKTDQEVRSEACWVVLNATSCGSDSQIEILVDEGCVSVLGVLLSEASMVMMALEGLERVLQVEETREMIRRERIDNGEILDDEEETNTTALVSSSLIEKARENNASGAVTKRAERIWRQHFVCCALCKKSFSRHRIADASFCEECKCHVCSNCNCQIYHLDYQEELWAASEEKTEAKKNAKKSRNKKKKAKLKEKKAKQQQDDTTSTKDNQQQQNQESSISANPKEEKKGADGNKQKNKANEDEQKKKETDNKRSPSPSQFEDEEDDDDNQIDLVLYLQQTGSIIALSKLMDALEFGGEDYDDELDDYERKMIREQQILRGQTTN